MSCTGPQDGSRTWRTADAVHIDVRGLEPPEPMVEILRLIDGGVIEGVLVAHLDREPIFLYPELDDRGLAYEVMEATCGESDCGDGVRVRIVRLSP
ncbi:MAG: DUF2249 domain-containing protein [Hyphomicrobiaceae bacterium]